MHAERTYAIDWIRVIAIGLLLVYHIAIGFQPWGMMIAFITNGQPWDSLWIPMSLLNVWRIPLLFFVSGMGVYFSLRNRTWKELWRERATRILIPLAVGAAVIVPVHVLLFQQYYHFQPDYTPGRGHLWFLGNILVYTAVFTPAFMYCKNNPDNGVVRALRHAFHHPATMLIVFAAFVAEAWLVPGPYELYAMTAHGFWLGMLAFVSGYCFVLSGEGFWHMLMRWRWFWLLSAAALFTVRLSIYNLHAPWYMVPIESVLWILTVLAFGYRYLNRPGRVLTYLSQAAYPVYILHMIALYAGSSLIFPLPLAAPVKFVLVLLITIGGCLLAYEGIRRVKILRLLFGLKV